MQDFINQLTELVKHMPWGTIGALLAASGITSALTQLVKKKLALVNKQVISFVLLVLSFVPVAIQYLTTAAAQNPAILGGRALAVAGLASTVVYPFIVRPATKLVQDAKALRTQQDSAVTPTVNVIEPSTDFPV